MTSTNAVVADSRTKLEEAKRFLVDMERIENGQELGHGFSELFSAYANACYSALNYLEKLEGDIGRCIGTFKRSDSMYKGRCGLRSQDVHDRPVRAGPRPYEPPRGDQVNANLQEYTPPDGGEVNVTLIQGKYYFADQSLSQEPVVCLCRNHLKGIETLLCHCMKQLGCCP